MRSLSLSAWMVVAMLAMLAFPGASTVEAQASGTPSQNAPLGVPASDIAFEPADAAHPTCPPFGACPPADQITDEYVAFGVDFTPFGANPPVGVFVDPPDKFGGVNGGGVLDLLTDTCGRIVLPGTTMQGLTDFIGMAGGFSAAPGDLLLEAYDVNGVPIGSSIADDGVDADGDFIAEVSDPTGSIASFCVSTPTADTYGVHFVYLNNPMGAEPPPPVVDIPTISGWGLILLALLMGAGAFWMFRNVRTRPRTESP